MAPANNRRRGMLFNSDIFICAFLPATLAVFYAFGNRGRGRAAAVWLVVASLFFYGWWNPAYVPILVGSVLCNFGLAAVLHARPDNRGLLALGVGLNLALLGYFKYANFLVDNFNTAADAGWSVAPIVLPLAISFFTFQQIAFLVDVRRQRSETPNFLSYCLFVTFFPQLIAGPIVYHREIMPQILLAGFGRLRSQNLAVGLTIFVIGLFKKVVLADNIAPYSTIVFDAAADGTTIGLLTAWQGALAYSAQIYFDFSGYSDMAIGLGRLFGIRLPLNFNSPYKAASIIDFWRRWHMTLSRFLRDYLYIPLGGGRSGAARRYVNLIIVMLLGGLWHGAAWTFLIWGGLHGAYLLINHIWRRARAGRDGGRAARLLGRALTVCAVIFAWVVFRADGMQSAMLIISGMIGLNGVEIASAIPWALDPAVRSFAPSLQSFVSWQGLLMGLVLLAFAMTAPNTAELMRRYRPVVDGIDLRAVPNWVLSWRPNAAYAAATVAMAAVSLLSLWSVSEFLYFQF